MEYPQLDLENAKGPKALIQTNHGDIKIQLFEKEAPMTVENFVRLAKKGYAVRFPWLILGLIQMAANSLLFKIKTYLNA